MPAARSASLALAGSCHPVPTLAVTTMAAVLAVAAGDAAGAAVLVVLAVLTGQLSIGWSNDLVDAGRDRAAGRTDKPFATGALDVRVLVTALAVTTAATTATSLLLGPPAAAAQLLVVLCGWLYNLGLKATLLSPVVYAVAFGALPAVATLARAHPAPPPWWVLGAGALLGVGAHFGNVLPDLDDDRRAGVRGVPQRLGRSGSALAAAAAPLVAAVLVLLGPAGPPTAAALLLATAVAGTGVLVVLIARRGRRLRDAFLGTVLAAALCLVMLVLSGGLGR